MEKKKIFFILDWDFTFLWKDTAKRLMDNNVMETESSCLVVGKNYLIDMNSGKIQHPFKTVYSLDELYEKTIYQNKPIDNIEKELDRLENEYGEETLWRFIWADRNHIKDGYDKNISQLIYFFNYFEEIYSKENPDLIVTNAYASMPHLISYAVARKMNITIINGMPIRIKQKTYWSEDCYEKLYPLEVNSQESIQEAQELIKDFRQKQEISTLQKIINDQHNTIKIKDFKRFLNYFYNFYITKKYSGHTKPNPFKKLIIQEIIPRAKQQYFKKIYKWNAYNKTDKYIYFPLQVQPEMTTMTYAHFYLNQYTLLEALSKNVPANYKIYVKEHPAMIGNNPKSFYNKLRKLPNVFVVSPSVNSFEIIQYSSMVATLTGTAGLEGLLLGKPVVTFGKSYYNDCKLVKYLADEPMTKWSSFIKDMLKNYNCDDKILIEFMATYLEGSGNFIIAEPTSHDEIMTENNLDKIANSIKVFIANKFK